jgi:hypothetical protein
MSAFAIATFAALLVALAPEEARAVDGAPIATDHVDADPESEFDEFDDDISRERDAPGVAESTATSVDAAADRRTEARIEALESRLEVLENANDELRVEQEIMLEERAEADDRAREAKNFAVRVGGYLDVGFFWAQSNGSGVRSDFGHRLFPEYSAVPDAWVFAGDPLSTAVNSRGEPADAGGSRALGFDSIDSRGKSTFLVNALNLQVFAQLGKQITVVGMVDFVPRSRDMSATDGLFLGDFIDVKLGMLRWDVPVRRFDFMIDVGKVDSVFGREYRTQEAPYRIEVTPSLLCRYTCGRPVGIKTRMLFFDRSLSVAASVTNGSSYQESFAFYNEIDRNEFKTMTGRIAYEIPVGAGLEFGASGQYGAQDLQSDDLVSQWQYGFDAHLDIRGLEVTAEFLQGRTEGAGSDAVAILDCAQAPCLRVLGAYGTVGYRALNWLMPFVRVDWRDAVHQSGADFVYVSQVTRISPGARFEVSPHVVIKAQYTFNLEVGRIPRIPNDIFTTSLVGYF